ncbi:unnamed protein product [Prunus armeniaca]
MGSGHHLPCTIIMSSDEGIQSSDSQVPKCLWGGSKVMKRRFVANLHRTQPNPSFRSGAPPLLLPCACQVGRAFDEMCGSHGP